MKEEGRDDVCRCWSVLIHRKKWQISLEKARGGVSRRLGHGLEMGQGKRALVVCLSTPSFPLISSVSDLPTFSLSSPDSANLPLSPVGWAAMPLLFFLRSLTLPSLKSHKKKI